MALKNNISDVKTYAEGKVNEMKSDLKSAPFKQITFRIEPDTYTDICKIAKDMNISRGSLLRIAARKLVKDGSISL